MRLKTVAKLGTVVSVLLFCLAVGYYAFMRLDMAEHNRDVNLFSLIPSNSIAVLESDHVDAFLNEYPNYNYGNELDNLQFPGLFNFLITELNEYAGHGLSNQLSRLMVSFHEPGTAFDQIVYFHMGMAEERILTDMLQDYLPTNFIPKEEKYRGKSIFVYPLSPEEFLSAYMDEGFVVLSYQKRLIEEVIDAQLDKTSLNDDALFARILGKKKSPDFLTLYGHSVSMPFLKTESECWSEYEFHLNSDVVYLTGNTYFSDEEDSLREADLFVEALPVVYEDGLMISADKDSTAFYMNQALESRGKDHNLFSECVANLSSEASFSLVADMQKVEEYPARFQDYLPTFMLENAALFRSFVFSVQLSMNDGCPSHMWVFTYKY